MKDTSIAINKILCNNHASLTLKIHEPLSINKSNSQAIYSLFFFF